MMTESQSATGLGASDLDALMNRVAKQNADREAATRAKHEALVKVITDSGLHAAYYLLGSEQNRLSNEARKREPGYRSLAARSTSMAERRKAMAITVAALNDATVSAVYEAFDEAMQAFDGYTAAYRVALPNNLHRITEH